MFKKKGVFIPNSCLNSRLCLCLPRSMERSILPHAMPDEAAKNKAFFSVPKTKRQHGSISINIIVDEQDDGLIYYSLRG